MAAKTPSGLTGDETPPQAGNGAGADDAALLPAGAAGGKKKPPAKPRYSRTKNKPGIFSVKEYPISEDKLDSLSTVRASSAFWTGVGSLALGFALSTCQSLGVAGADVTPEASATWAAYATAGFIVAGVCYGAAVIYYCKTKSMLQFIKDNTVHADDEPE
jgi:hypothetical protein